MSSTDNTIVKKMAVIVISTEDLYKMKVEVKICSKPVKNIKMGEVYRIDTELLAVAKAHTWKEFVKIVFVKKLVNNLLILTLTLGKKKIAV